MSNGPWRTAERPGTSPASPASDQSPQGHAPHGHSHHGHSHQGHSHQGHSHQGHSHQGHSHQGHSHQGQGVWVDDANTVVRRGMVASLLAEGIPVIGESTALCPEPALPRIKVLLFEADGVESPEVLQHARRLNIQLVATVRQPTGVRLRTLAEEGVAAILLMAELTPESLVHAVRSATQDRTTLSRSTLMRLLDHVARFHSHSASQLTSREQLVLQLLADGKETRSIAQEMNYSERTVKNVVHDVLTKLNCRTRAQAVGVAMRNGII